jgi:hypothetical protein
VSSTEPVCKDHGEVVMACNKLIHLHHCKDFEACNSKSIVYLGQEISTDECLAVIWSLIKKGL